MSAIAVTLTLRAFPNLSLRTNEMLWKLKSPFLFSFYTQTNNIYSKNFISHGTNCNEKTAHKPHLKLPVTLAFSLTDLVDYLKAHFFPLKPFLLGSFFHELQSKEISMKAISVRTAACLTTPFFNITTACTLAKLRLWHVRLKRNLKLHQ